MIFILQRYYDYFLNFRLKAFKIVQFVNSVHANTQNIYAKYAYRIIRIVTAFLADLTKCSFCAVQRREQICINL